MKMGRERGVLGWDIHRYLLTDEIDRIQEEQARLLRGAAGDVASNRQRGDQLAMRLAELKRQLKAIGPSPRARMG
jgi:uncharacterized protein involved in exopolysaccharide biosynthesis